MCVRSQQKSAPLRCLIWASDEPLDGYNPDREQKKRKHAPKPDQSRSSFVTVKETAHVFAWGVVVSQSTACWISTQILSPSLVSSSSCCPILISTSLFCSNAFSSHPSDLFIWICCTCSLLHLFPLSTVEKRTSSKHNSAGVFFSSLHTHQVEEGEGVIAVCRWRACGSCWLWRLLYVRGWTKRRIGAPLWPCCSESRPLSRSHKLAWLELDCGLRAPDHDLPRPLVLQKRKKKNTHKACECWLDSCFTEHAWGNHKFTLRVVTWMWITTDLLLWKHVYFKRGPLKANSSASAAKCQARQPWGKTRGTLTYNNRKSAEWKTGSNLNVTCSFPVKSVCVCVAGAMKKLVLWPHTS